MYIKRSRLYFLCLSKIQMPVCPDFGRLNVRHLHILPGLTNPVTPVLCLFVVVGVKVEIMENYGVGSRQVDAQTSGSGGKNEHKDAVIIVVLVD